MTDTEVTAIALAVVSASTASLVWWMTHQVAAGRIPRSSRTFGIRTPRTRASDASWVRSHEVALPWTLAGRYVAGVLAVATLVAVGADREAPLGIILGLCAALTVPATYGLAVLAIHRVLPAGEPMVPIGFDSGLDSGLDSGAESPPAS